MIDVAIGILLYNLLGFLLVCGLALLIAVIWNKEE